MPQNVQAVVHRIRKDSPKHSTSKKTLLSSLGYLWIFFDKFVTAAPARYHRGKAMNPYLFVQGDNFLQCCEKEDYRVTISGENCTINDILINAISFTPPRGPWKSDNVIVSYNHYISTNNHYEFSAYN